MLSVEALSTVLYALATGYTDRAVNVIAMSDEIEEEARAVLWRALTEDDHPAAQARRLGDALRSLGAGRPLVNECYRISFYASDDWMRLSGNELFAFFSANRAGQPLDKWVHYFPIYERHLAPYRRRAVQVLEIGVYRGGGLQMLRHYLGPEAFLVGIDIDEAARQAVRDRYPVEMGDQEDPDFLRGVADRHGPFDIIVDDGGHTMRQQIASVETLFPLLNDGGTYIVEDCHTSYWPEYADPEPAGPTFIGWLKERIDDIHAYHHSRAEQLLPPWQTSLCGIHIYDSVAVLDKDRRWAPFSELSGTKEFINFGREVAASQVEVLATRDAALAQMANVEARAAQAAAEADIRVAQAAAEADTRVAEAVTLAAQAAAEADARAAQLTTDADARVAQATAEADARVAQLAAQADTRVAQATAEADARVAKATAEADAGAAQAAADREAAREELRILRGELVDARRAVGQLQANLDSVNEELAHLRGDLLGSWGIIEEMRRSRSWRATAPLRRVKSILKRR